MILNCPAGHSAGFRFPYRLFFGILQVPHPMLLTRRLNLRDDERVVTIVRPSWIAYASSFFLAAAGLFLAFFLIVPFFARGRFGLAVFILLILASTYAGVRGLWFWYWNALVVTDARVIDIDQRGFFRRGISEARYEKMEDVSIEVRGIIATILHLGVIRIVAANGHNAFELRSVSRPESVQELIGRLREAAGQRGVIHHWPINENVLNFSDTELIQLRERIDVELRMRRERQVVHRVKGSDPVA